MNAPHSAEATILLDLIMTMHSKSHNINSRNLPIAIDNEHIWKMINRGLQTSNQYIQDNAVEVKIMQKIIQQTTININLERVDSHKNY